MQRERRTGGVLSSSDGTGDSVIRNDVRFDFTKTFWRGSDELDSFSAVDVEHVR